MSSQQRPLGGSAHAAVVADTGRAVAAMRCGLVCATSAGLLALEAAWPELASAHGISGLASLPVPAWLFAWAAAIVLVVSFVALSTLWSCRGCSSASVSALGARSGAARRRSCGLIGRRAVRARHLRRL